MRLNLDFWNKQEESDINIDAILELINKCETINYEKELDVQNISIETLNLLSNCIQNSLYWYEFKDNCSVLEIGTEFGVLTDFLCDKASEVVSIDWYQKRADIVSNLLNNRKNLEIIVGKLKEVLIKEKFDYVILMSNYKCYQKLGINSLEELLIVSKTFLKDDGIILFATDNKFGVKYFSGAFEQNTSLIFGSLQKESDSDNPLPSKKDIEEVLKKLEFRNYRFFYPLPDYHVPAVIFTDGYLPQRNDSKLVYPLNYTSNSVVVMNEIKLLRQFANNNNFEFFANSYIIEISNSNLKDDLALYISFNNIRKEEYRMVTKIKNTYVEKEVRNNYATKHMLSIAKNISNLKKLGFNLLDSYDEKNKKLISNFSKYEQFSSFLIELIKKNDMNEFKRYVNLYYDELKSKLLKNEDKINIENSNIIKKLDVNLDNIEMNVVNNQMYIIKNGYIDLTFENIFLDLKNSLFLYFDQEWFFENAPLEYILYRSLNNIYIYAELNKYYSFEKILKEFEIYQYKDIFEKIEKSFQEYIISKNRVIQVKLASQTFFNINKIKEIEIDNHKLLERALKKEKELNDTIECVNILRKQKDDLEMTLKNKEEELSKIYNSNFWKVWQKLKYIVKGKENK